MNSVSLTSRSTSVSVITVFPTTTATLSITCACAIPASNAAATPNALIPDPISKCLPDRNEEVKMAHALHRRGRSPEEELLVRSLQSEERRRVDRVREVHAHRPHRRAVPDTEPGRVHHIIE